MTTEPGRTTSSDWCPFHKQHDGCPPVVIDVPGESGRSTSSEPSVCPEWCVHKDAGLGYHRHTRMNDEERHEWGFDDTPESRLHR